jgi:hypothetical protein
LFKRLSFRSNPGSSVRFNNLRAFLLPVCILSLSMSAAAQATNGTAMRKADLQVGGYFSFSPVPDYSTQTLYGGGGYVTFDFTHNLGVEVNIKHVQNTTALGIYERTYEIGPRYVKHFGIFSPYARASIGRGVFNYPMGVANIAYNMYSFGAGADIRVKKHINVRGDAEYQIWQNFPVHHLTPTVVSAGVAYHF